MSYGSKQWQDWVLEEEEGIQHIKAAFVRDFTPVEARLMGFSLKI